MRFPELLVLAPNNKLVNINDSVYEQMVDRWTREMGVNRLFGYRKETRIKHFQEAVDTVYTALEGELQTADPRKIMSHPKWTILVGCAKRNFPDHLSVYQPSPLEQTRMKRMVRNTLTTRIIANKIDLLDIIKLDNTDSPGNIGEVAVSRLRYELLAASAARVHDRYMTELDSDWRTWYEWQQKTAGMYNTSTSTTTVDSNVTGFGSGIRGLSKGSAEASAGFTSNVSAGLSRGTEWQKGGFDHRLKGKIESI
nr:hypothetical protein [Endozoicomonas sp.]